MVNDQDLDKLRQFIPLLQEDIERYSIISLCPIHILRFQDEIKQVVTHLQSKVLEKSRQRLQDN